MVYPSTIRNKTGRKRVCVDPDQACIWSAERPQLCRIGNRKGLYKSDDGGNSQWRASTRNESIIEEVRGSSSHDLPEWLEEFKKKSVPEHQNASFSSHELPSKPASKSVSGKHSIFTHFPKDRNCDICLRIKITKVSCRRRTGTVEPRAQHFGD